MLGKAKYFVLKKIMNMCLRIILVIGFVLLPAHAAFLAVVEVDDSGEFSRLKNKEKFVFLAVEKLT